MGYRKGYYRKDGTYVQGHYANNKSKSFSNKNNGCLVLLLAGLLSGLPISCSDSSSEKTDCPTKTCGDFKTQSAAQSAYNGNTSCYKNLDADEDGIACENLPK